MVIFSEVHPPTRGIKQSIQHLVAAQKVLVSPAPHLFLKLLNKTSASLLRSLMLTIRVKCPSLSYRTFSQKTGNFFFYLIVIYPDHNL